MEKSVHIKTFGCQMNVYDSDRLRQLMEAQGYRFESDPRRADVILLNTCSIRDKAEHKVLSLLGQLKPLKAENPNAVIGVGGCVGQRMGDSLLKRVEHLDLVFGPDGIDRVPGLVADAFEGKRRTVDTVLDGAGRSYSQPAVVTGRAKPSEFLTIMKGCDHFCTYCIVPYTRGREKSRSIAEIVADVRGLVARGTKEVTFLGQNINTYGKGTGETLAQLIEAAVEVEGLERLRYITAHPRDHGDDLIAQVGRLPKLMPSLHLPFQSGSDRILKRMNRLYTRDQYLAKLDRIRAASPDIALSTDVIVGFPGETEEEFQESLDVLAKVGFSTAYLFKYSPRPGTKAFQWPDEFLSEEVKEERLLRAQQVAFPLIEKENLSYIGRTVPVLIESPDKKALAYSGHDPRNKLIHVINAGPALLGHIVDVEITEANGSNLRGYYVGAPRVSVSASA